VGKKKLRYKHFGPSFYLVSAVQTCAGDWQRWEIEVAHREMKSGLGAKRWSLTTLWRAYCSDLWNKHEIRPLWTTTADNWWKKETWFAA